MKTPQVENMTGRTGRPVANQFLIYTDDGVTFQSYSTKIAHRDVNGIVTLSARYWNCSRTTAKYRRQFLGEGKSETELKIASGEYKLADVSGL